MAFMFWGFKQESCGVLLGVLSMVWCTFARSYTNKMGTIRYLFYLSSKEEIRRPLPSARWAHQTAKPRVLARREIRSAERKYLRAYFAPRPNLSFSANKETSFVHQDKRGFFVA